MDFPEVALFVIRASDGRTIKEAQVSELLYPAFQEIRWREGTGGVRVIDFVTHVGDEINECAVIRWGDWPVVQKCTDLGYPIESGEISEYLAGRAARGQRERAARAQVTVLPQTIRVRDGRNLELDLPWAIDEEISSVARTSDGKKIAVIVQRPRGNNGSAEVFLALWALDGDAARPAEGEQFLSIAQAEGAVEIRKRGESVWRAATVGLSPSRGDEIRTRAGVCHLHAIFSEGKGLYIVRPNSHIRIDDAIDSMASKMIRLTHSQGALGVRLPSLHTGEDVGVSVGAVGVISVRGTAFEIRGVGRDTTATQVDVTEGVIDFRSGVSGEVRRVPAGNRVVFSRGGIPGIESIPPETSEVGPNRQGHDLFLLLEDGTQVLGSTDEGRTFRRLTGAWNESLNYTFSDSTHGIAFGGRHAVDGIFRTTRGWGEWRPVMEEIPSDLGSSYRLDSNHVWIGGTGGMVLRTADDGISWSSVPVGAEVTIRALAFTDSTSGWATAEHGKLFRTENGGASWTEMPAISDEDFEAIQAVSESEVVLVGRSFNTSELILFGTENGGADWERLGIIRSDNGKDRIFFPPGSFSPILVRTYSWGGDSEVHRFDFERGRWAGVLDFEIPGSLTPAVSFISPQVGYLGGEDGFLFRTENGGASWTRVNVPTSSDIPSVIAVPRPSETER